MNLLKLAATLFLIIGFFVTSGSASTTVSTTSNPTFNTAVSNVASISPYTINFDNTSPATLAISSSPNIMNYGVPLTLTIGNTSSSAPVTLQKSSSSPFVRLLWKSNASLTLNVQNLIINGFTSASSTSSGGAIYIDSSGNYYTLNLNCVGDTTFSNNSINYNNGNGGAISVNYGDFNLTGTNPLTFSNNKSGSSTTGGGAIYAWGTINLNSSGPTLFKGNQSPSGAGGALRSSAVLIQGNGPVTFDSNTALNGGAILTRGGNGVTINSSATTTFTGNRATNGSGGAIYTALADILIKASGDTVFDGNTATNNGGALYSERNVTLDGAGQKTFQNNSVANGSGGAIYAGTGMIVQGQGTTIFDQNQATNGGAIYTPSTVTLSEGENTFSDNSATNNGGAVSAGSQVTLTGDTNSTFSGNSATNNGGALYSAQSVTLSTTGTTTFQNNSATNGAGGAIDGVTGVILQGTGPTVFEQNTAAAGGGIYSGADLSINGDQPTSFTNNQASQAGGALYTAANIDIAPQTPTIFTHNTATISGGAVCLSSGGSGSIDNAEFDGNSSGNYGGAISQENPSSTSLLTLANTSFDSNTASNLGGAIFSRSNLTITDSTFTNNTAGQSGGAIFMGNGATHSTLTFDLLKDITFNPSSSLPSGYLGDNDMACYSNGSQFVKTGSADLILNTQNSGWIGSTTVQQGAMIVGQSLSNSTATWGSSTAPSQALVVENGATVGGFGTLYTTGATFNTGSTWLVGISPDGQSGHLNSSGLLSFAAGSTLYVQPVLGTYDPRSYILATASGGITNNGLNVAIDPSTGLQGLYEIAILNYAGNKVILTITNAVNLPFSPSFELNDTVITALSQLNEASFSPKNSEDDFVSHFNPSNLAPLKNRDLPVNIGFSQNQQDMPSNLLQAISKKGRMVVATNQYRLWAAPYYAQGNTDAYNGQLALRDHHEGFVVGAEKRSLKNKWTIGFMSGFGLGSTTFPETIKTNTSDKDMFFGLYHSLGFLEHARYDILLNSIFSTHQGQRYGKIDAQNNYLALSNYHSRTLSANLETSYQFKFKNKSSIRPNLGLTLAESKRNRYQERNAGLNNRIFAERKDSSQEIYGGLGYRKQWVKGNYEIKLTGVWEHGYEMAGNTTQETLYTVNGPKSGFAINQEGTGRHTTYLTAYGSVLNTKTNLKVLAGYSGSIQKHRTVHNFSLKLEVRF